MENPAFVALLCDEDGNGGVLKVPCNPGHVVITPTTDQQNILNAMFSLAPWSGVSTDPPMEGGRIHAAVLDAEILHDKDNIVPSKKWVHVLHPAAREVCLARPILGARRDTLPGGGFVMGPVGL